MKTTLMTFALLGLMATSPALIQSSKADMISGREDLTSISSFCRDRLAILKNAYRQAELESQLGNVSNSVAILEAGLRTANARINPRLANSLTAKSIRRGLTLLDNLKSTAAHKQKTRAINNFLFNYFIFIENVSNSLDIPFFASDSGYKKAYNSNERFERLFIDFSKEQVEMVLATMTSTSQEGRYEIIYPIGSPTLVLTALRVTTLAMANDLSDSLFAAHYACTIEELDNVSTNISLYLTGQSPYSDDFVAVQELVGAAKHALHGAKRCQGEDQERSPRTMEAIDHAFRLEAGTTQQVNLPTQQYIKKIIISAEGLRNDAMFDVVVNGDIKGTVFVPGRDPSYFVTIEDSARSIEFVSRNGTAVISRILVVTE
jgi:hypothetical protein